MDAMQLLCSIYHLAGERGLIKPFSAKWVSEELKYSIYTSRKLIKSLVEYGILFRFGNQYVISNHGYDAVLSVVKASNHVKG